MSDILKIGSTVDIELLFDAGEWDALPENFTSVTGTAIHESGGPVYVATSLVDEDGRKIFLRFDSETMPEGLFNVDVEISNADGVVTFVPESTNIQFILVEGVN